MITDDYPIDRDNPDIYNLLSDNYIKTGNATDAQKLLSNYYLDSNGNVQLKSIKQKAIDLYYAVENQTDLGLSYMTTLKPFIETFQYDLMHYGLNIEERDVMETVMEDVYGEKKVVDEEAYSYQDEDAWQDEHNEWQRQLDEIPEEIPADPVYGDPIPVYETRTVAEEYLLPGKRFPLTCNTVTDEDAYNKAMNDYNYKQHQYEHKIQEINSKLEIIQLQDKQLELKLKQLDTEENAISTEMDAVKKVISKNVDSSFKTFSA